MGRLGGAWLFMMVGRKPAQAELGRGTGTPPMTGEAVMNGHPAGIPGEFGDV